MRKLLHQGHQLEDALHGALVGAADGQHDAELWHRPAASRLLGGSQHFVGIEERVAWTGVENRDDCEQKWQSSGQPPVLAERMPSTSTPGPHQARRTWWARAAIDVTHRSGRDGQAPELLAAAEQAAFVEQGGLGRSQSALNPGRRRIQVGPVGPGPPG